MGFEFSWGEGSLGVLRLLAPKRDLGSWLLMVGGLRLEEGAGCVTARNPPVSLGEERDVQYLLLGKGGPSICGEEVRGLVASRGGQTPGMRLSGRNPYLRGISCKSPGNGPLCD